jgi:AraC-like DNA-binding protein
LTTCLIQRAGPSYADGLAMLFSPDRKRSTQQVSSRPERPLSAKPSTRPHGFSRDPRHRGRPSWPFLLAERHSVSALQSMVANQLVALLPSGEARAAAVAQRLGMSTRSFTRHLAEEGTTFGEILERLRQHLASGYLADNRMSSQQIAWLLGYSEPSAFTHAYKRWTGTTPRRARKRPPAPR